MAELGYRVFRGLLVALILLLTSAIALFVYHLGIFNKPVLEIKSYPQLHLVFKQHKGPYSELPAAAEEVRQWANSMHLSCTDTFDELLSNWQRVPASDLLANVGCVVQGEVKDLGEYQYKEIPAQEYLVGTFLGSFSESKSPLFEAILDYKIKNRKKISGSVIRIHHEVNPLWRQPVQVILHTLVDSDPP